MLETPFFELGKPGLKRVKNCYIGYEITDYGSDNPTAAVSFITTPEETSYTASTALAEATTYRRERREIARQAPGVALKLARSGAGDFLVYDLGYEAHSLEQSRRAA